MVRLDIDGKVLIGLGLVAILMLAMASSELRGETLADEAELRASFRASLSQLKSDNRIAAAAVSRALAAEIVSGIAAPKIELLGRVDAKRSSRQLAALKDQRDAAAGQSDRT